MKIQKINIKEFKILSDFEAEINGNNIFLLGDNALGKSSVIQFIEIALGKQGNVPIGADGSGYVVTDKSGKQYTFFVKIKDGKAVVTVECDGMKDSRKGTLQAIIGAMDFNIDDFVELSKSVAGRKKQVEIFKSFLPEETRTDFAQYEANLKAIYDERTELSRVMKSTEGAMREHPLHNLPDLSGFSFVDTNALMSELNIANEKNQKISDVENRKSQRELAIVNYEQQIKQFESQILKLKVDRDAEQGKNNQAILFLNTNKKTDTTEIQTKIGNAAETNARAEAANQLLKLRQAQEMMSKEFIVLDEKINNERQAISDAIREMEAPIDGLMFEGEQLLYKGIAVSPDSLSTSEIMELGIRLKMAENPDLGILFIERGESLGKARLKEIVELAEKNGWQLIVEQVVRGNGKLTVEIIKAE